MTLQVVVVLELFAADVTAEVLDEDLVDGAYVAFQRLRRGEDIAALVTVELHASGKKTTGAMVSVELYQQCWGVRGSLPVTNGSGYDSYLR